MTIAQLRDTIAGAANILRKRGRIRNDYLGGPPETNPPCCLVGALAMGYHAVTGRNLLVWFEQETTSVLESDDDFRDVVLTHCVGYIPVSFEEESDFDGGARYHPRLRLIRYSDHPIVSEEMLLRLLGNAADEANTSQNVED